MHVTWITCSRISRLKLNPILIKAASDLSYLSDTVETTIITRALLLDFVFIDMTFVTSFLLTEWNSWYQKEKKKKKIKNSIPTVSSTEIARTSWNSSECEGLIDRQADRSTIDNQSIGEQRERAQSRRGNTRNARAISCLPPSSSCYRPESTMKKGSTMRRDLDWCVTRARGTRGVFRERVIAGGEFAEGLMPFQPADPEVLRLPSPGRVS